MTMIVVPYKAEHLARMQVQEAQRYLGRHMTPELAKSLESTLAFTALDGGGRVLIVAGVVEMWQNRALAWSYIDQHAGKHFLAIHRAVARFLEDAPFRRIEAEVDCEFEPGHRWARKLGFVLEAPRMRSFRIDGGDSALYARVK